MGKVEDNSSFRFCTFTLCILYIVKVESHASYMGEVQISIHATIILSQVSGNGNKLSASNDITVKD